MSSLRVNNSKNNFQDLTVFQDPTVGPNMEPKMWTDVASYWQNDHILFQILNHL